MLLGPVVKESLNPFSDHSLRYAIHFRIITSVSRGEYRYDFWCIDKDNKLFDVRELHNIAGRIKLSARSTLPQQNCRLDRQSLDALDKTFWKPFASEIQHPIRVGVEVDDIQVQINPAQVLEKPPFLNEEAWLLYIQPRRRRPASEFVLGILNELVSSPANWFKSANLFDESHMTKTTYSDPYSYLCDRCGPQVWLLENACSIWTAAGEHP